MFGTMKAEPKKEAKEMKLYEIAVIMTDNTGKSEIIVPPTPLLAANDDAAKLQAGRKIPRAYDEVMADMKVLVRAFC